MEYPMDQSKRLFLVVYDYGMGGLWGLIWARSEDEILSRYPELVVAQERPKWMTSEDYVQLERTRTYDIDEAPTGILNAVVSDRTHE
jgi:hypothetical protein